MAYMLLVNKTSRPGEAQGFQRMFAPDQLTLGVYFPIEKFHGDQPTMERQEHLARRAEELGFAALWLRDVPLRVRHYGDIAQVYDPWTYLCWIAAHTRTIALAIDSLLLPLRHPLHTAKAAASLDRLSGGRLVLGVGSGGETAEFAAFGVDHAQRSALFRENFRVIRSVLAEEFPHLQSSYGVLSGEADLVPKPTGWLPMLVTGHSGQRLSWIAQHADGWITMPRGLGRQTDVALHWRTAVARTSPAQFKPLIQPLHIDLTDKPGDPATAIHLGFRGGRNAMFHLLDARRGIGINHVILNFKHGARDAEEVLEEIGNEILPLLKATSSKAPPRL